MTGLPQVAHDAAPRHYLAIDLGASSGRGVVGTLEGGVMQLHEVHRFRTPLVDDGAHLSWDLDAIWREITVAVTHALVFAPALRSVSVDSWAVDYQPLDAAGNAVRVPYAYRDPRTHGRMDHALSRAGGVDAVYARTGIQLLDFNTLVQVVCDIDDEPAGVAATRQRLLIADYFNARLGGRAVVERSMASSTQLMDVQTGTWAADLITAIGDDLSRWPPIVPSGTVLGAMRSLPAAHAGHDVPQVIATCSHDTGCAVAAVPHVGDEPWAFLCTGTWSLIGAELQAPILTREACAAGFSNEAGMDGTIRFLKNRTGMWVLQECQREWHERGVTVSHLELAREATAAGPSAGTIDLDAPPFMLRGDMDRKIAAACTGAGLAAPTSRGALVRLIYDSLAQGYAAALDQLDRLTGRRAATLHVVGGASQNALLNQLIADATGRRVVAGPVEATVLGNLLLQARTLGDLPQGMPVREAAHRSSTLQRYTPRSLHRAPALVPARS